MNLKSLKTDLVYPFKWIRNFFEVDMVVPFQVLALRNWGTKDSYQENGEENIPRSAMELRTFIRNCHSNELLESVSIAADTKLELKNLSFQIYSFGGHKPEDQNDEFSLTLFLSPQWKYYWGGTVDFKRHKTWGSVATPIVGSALLHLPSRDWSYQVTRVKEEAAIPRLSTVLTFLEKT